MHPHEVEFRIRNLLMESNYKIAESILIELKNSNTIIVKVI